MIIQAINKCDPAHLLEVIEEMNVLGAPTIRVFNTGDSYLALEGSHRLAAAEALELTPVFVELSEDDEMVSDIDIYDEDGSHYGSRPVPVAAILDMLAQAHGNRPVYSFEA